MKILPLEVFKKSVLFSSIFSKLKFSRTPVKLNREYQRISKSSIWDWSLIDFYMKPVVKPSLQQSGTHQKAKMEEAAVVLRNTCWNCCGGSYHIHYESVHDLELPYSLAQWNRPDISHLWCFSYCAEYNAHSQFASQLSVSPSYTTVTTPNPFCKCSQFYRNRPHFANIDVYNFKAFTGSKIPSMHNFKVWGLV